MAARHDLHREEVQLLEHHVDDPGYGSRDDRRKPDPEADVLRNRAHEQDVFGPVIPLGIPNGSSQLRVVE